MGSGPPKGTLKPRRNHLFVILLLFVFQYFNMSLYDQELLGGRGGGCKHSGLSQHGISHVNVWRYLPLMDSSGISGSACSLGR